MSPVILIRLIAGGRAKILHHAGCHTSRECMQTRSKICAVSLTTILSFSRLVAIVNSRSNHCQKHSTHKVESVDTAVMTMILLCIHYTYTTTSKSLLGKLCVVYFVLCVRHIHPPVYPCGFSTTTLILFISPSLVVIAPTGIGPLRILTQKHRKDRRALPP